MNLTHSRMVDSSMALADATLGKKRDLQYCHMISSTHRLRGGRYIRPISDQVLIRLIAPERMIASKRLFIPDSARREDSELYNGQVLACGPGKLRLKDGKLNPIEVKPGDKVMFYWLAGETRVGTRMFDEDGSELLIIREEYVMGVRE